MENLRYKCMSKGTNKETGTPRTSHNWITSKRGTLKIYDSLITLGSWEFKTINIKNPILYKCKSFPIPAKVLVFDYEDKQYQFGLNPWANPLPHLPFAAKVESKSLNTSIFSIIFKIVIYSLILYKIIQRVF